MGVCPRLSGASARASVPVVEPQTRVDYSYVTTVQEREMYVYRWFADQNLGDQTYTCPACQAVWFCREPSDNEAARGLLEAWRTVSGQRFVSDANCGPSRRCRDCGAQWVMV